MLWFRLLAQKKNVPLFVIDYPAVANGQASLLDYITRQYETLVEFVRYHAGSDLDASILREQVERSRETCRLWKRVHEVNKARPASIEVHKIVDALFPIVVAKGTPQAFDYYKVLLHEYSQTVEQGAAEAVRLLWHGYPMWFLPKKFPRGVHDKVRIVLDDYTLWWSLDYPDDCTAMETLATLQRKVEDVVDLAADYAVDGVVCHVNRSCRRALADVNPLRKRLRQLGIPSVTIESDMANPSFYSDEQVQLRLESFCDALGVR